MFYMSHKRILYAELQVSYPLLYFPFFKKVLIHQTFDSLSCVSAAFEDSMGLPNPTFLALFCYVVVTTKRLTTKSMPHHQCNRNRFVGVTIFGSEFGKFHYGLRNYWNWDFFINSILYQPVNFSSV